MKKHSRHEGFEAIAWEGWRALIEISFAGKNYRSVDLPAEAAGALPDLPYVLRILLENVVRTGGEDGPAAKQAILDWLPGKTSAKEIPFQPGRVLMHDTTCGPALADIAAMRSYLSEAGRDPSLLNPVLPVDVSTCHSIPVDYFARTDAVSLNLAGDYRRNAERYRFMKWATTGLKGMRVHPPGTGIMHTINLERLATVVAVSGNGGSPAIFPDSLIGTDSHTPMINGIGVLAWGVGGLEAESVMFGMPVMLRVPEVVGVRLTGALAEGVLSTDLAIFVTERLRRMNLADRFVEFFGPGVSTLSAGDRACVANMAPEYGASTGFFPVDEKTLTYLRQTGRSEDQVRLVEEYIQRQGLWFDPQAEPRYTEIVEVDLSTIRNSVAGPKRPQDRISLGAVAASVASLRQSQPMRRWASDVPPDGAVAIAAITSCTNTSDPRLLVAAGLVARKARALGLRPPHWVKTSLAPGSPTAELYLRRSGLLEDLEAVGFGIVGYGCTTCIGNSGKLTEPILAAMRDREITPVIALSGNRNFPGRVHPDLDAAFIMAPPLVVAFALADDCNRNLESDPLGAGSSGRPIYLRDIWPRGEEIDLALERALDQGDVREAYERAEASEAWSAMNAPETALFPWDPNSTYIRRPPFATGSAESPLGSFEAYPLLVLGDDITTDHISPVGQIPAASEAGKYLIARGEQPGDLNVYASRRANWEVMLRGAFTNKAVRNLLDPDLPPGQTLHGPSGQRMSLMDAAARYRSEKLPVVIVAGERYGMGSSRDWAAKAVALLGVRAVLASGFERIHRSNLINMGILPVRLPAGMKPADMQLESADKIALDFPPENAAPRADVTFRILRRSGGEKTLHGTAAIETRLEVDILKHGGMIPFILNRKLSA